MRIVKHYIWITSLSISSFMVLLERDWLDVLTPQNRSTTKVNFLSRGVPHASIPKFASDLSLLIWGCSPLFVNTSHVSLLNSKQHWGCPVFIFVCRTFRPLRGFGSLYRMPRTHLLAQNHPRRLENHDSMAVHLSASTATPNCLPSFNQTAFEICSHKKAKKGYAFPALSFALMSAESSTSLPPICSSKHKVLSIQRSCQLWLKSY